MSEDAVAVDPSATVTVEQGGRTLSGTAGVSSDRLAETMDRRASADEANPPVSATELEKQPIPAETQPKPTRGQARFSELTQKAKDAAAETARIRQEFDDYKARAAQQTPAAPSAHPPVAASTAGPVPGDTGQPSTRPEPSEDEVGTKYQTYGAFVQDHGKWVVEQQQAALPSLIEQRIHASQQQQAFAAHVESTRAKGRAVYTDFDAMLQSGPGTYVNMPPGAIHAIYQLPNTEHVQYAIMKDGALAQKLASLAARDPYAFGLELALIAPATPAVSTASTGTVGSVTPPPPMKPVGQGSTTTIPSSADHAKAGNYQAYKASRAAERGGMRRR